MAGLQNELTFEYGERPHLRVENSRWADMLKRTGLQGMKHQALSEIALRLPDPAIVAKGELSKSSRTRLRILNGAIDCLAELGYAGPTTSTVALRAHLT